MKDVDIEESKSFLDHVYLGCTQRTANPTRKSLDNTTKCSNPAFLLEQPTHYQDRDKHRTKTPATWKDMLENVWNCVANWQTRRQSNFSRFLVLVSTIT